MDVVIGPLFWLISTVVSIYIWLLIAGAVLSWLIAFNVVNTRNRFVYTVGDFLHRVTEPALRPIRRILPHLGGIDLSPMVLILLLLFLQQVLARLYVATFS
jgi:YggT family protein